jgi:hypothetical protein
VTSRPPIFVDLSDREAVARNFGRFIQGANPAGISFVYNNIGINIFEALDGVPRAQLDKHVLVFMEIPVKPMVPWRNGVPVGKRRLPVWAVCPRRVRSSSLRMAREGLNGTLVLVEAAGNPEAVAYLTITHAHCGTYLLPADDTGKIHIDIKPPQRSDIMMTLGGDFQQRYVFVFVFKTREGANHQKRNRFHFLSPNRTISGPGYGRDSSSM